VHETLNRELFPAEKEFIEGRPKFEADFIGLFAKDKAKAQKMLEAYVAAAFEKVSSLTAKLLSKAPGS
jgi:hypothetical protein